MILRSATLDDLRAASSWVSSQRETDLWTGGKVMYPIDFHQMVEAILWSEAGNHALGMDHLLAFGQVITKDSGRRHLSRLIVNPARRGEGLGRQLLAGLLEAAIASGAVVASLNVDPLNETAIRLYERLGFRANPESPHAEPARFIYMEYTP